MKSIRLYQEHLKNNLIKPDPAQAAVVTQLQVLYDALTPRTLFSRFFSKNSKKGLYLWGEVGRGKTYLMDLFYDCLPFKNKKRIHFHAFMRDTHDRLYALQGHRNPLTQYAKEIAKTARVLCLDEFIVLDIADAMILANLLQALFKAGVCLVTTANTMPDRLYWNGLQRERFLPAIDLIKTHLYVLQLAHPTDYRLQHLIEAQSYFFPLDEVAAQNMQQAFLHLSHPPRQKNAVLTIEGRSIQTRYLASPLVWFDAEALCGIPRSARDYLKLVEQFNVILVSQIPPLTDANFTRNFISLVDIAYDAKVRLILSAAVPLEALCEVEKFKQEFKRTYSRLMEMQSPP